MTQTLDSSAGVRPKVRGLDHDDLRGRNAREVEREVDRFLSELRMMTLEERVRASRYTMNRWEYWAYAARFPDEAPTVNGELERIALTLE